MNTAARIVARANSVEWNAVDAVGADADDGNAASLALLTGIGARRVGGGLELVREASLPSSS